MRLDAPRIEPVDLDRLDADQRAALEPFLAPDTGAVGGKVGAAGCSTSSAPSPTRRRR